jgi:ferrous iron transport protein B
MSDTAARVTQDELVRRADELRRSLGQSFRDDVVEAIFADAEEIAQHVVSTETTKRRDVDQVVDRLLTSPVTGLPIMGLGLAAVFWVTVMGANYPSQLLSLLLFGIEDYGSSAFESVGAPWWLTGFVWHGVYRGLAWVVAVMLPPMAIFFPIFTILEDLGFLPRVAFNMDRLFKSVGAHGKQALTMSMGFGCNAAGVIATRIIDSPRERLIAILTNNFVPCNGRFPTLIMLSTVFVAAAFPAALASVIAAMSVMTVVVLGIVVTLLVSALLSRTVLSGEASSFTLELPPYRRPNILQTLYTSLIDRTLFVLYRAILMAAPAGGLIWLMANIHVGGESLITHIASVLDPFGEVFGLDGVIILAYIVAIPANEIVIPVILMAYIDSGMMADISSTEDLRVILVDQHGWTTLTAICLMLFSLLHNPCSTTLWTIWAETRSRKWTIVGALLPLSIAFAVTFVVAQAARLAGFT